MVVAHRHHLRPGLINLAMDNPLGILRRVAGADPLGVEVVFDEILRRHQFGRARPRQEIAARIIRMAHADMAEGVDHAFMGDNLIGERQFGAGFGELIGHGRFPLTE